MIRTVLILGQEIKRNMFKDLRFSWTKHIDDKYSDRQYLDFIISGQSLRDYLKIENRHIVTPFGFFPGNEIQINALKEFRLQKKTRLSDDRIELYICEACGDIGCGAITAKIIDQGDKIVWTQFASQSQLDEIGEIINIEKIEFDRQNYFKAFSTIS